MDAIDPTYQQKTPSTRRVRSHLSPRQKSSSKGVTLWFQVGLWEVGSLTTSAIADRTYTGRWTEILLLSLIDFRCTSAEPGHAVKELCETDSRDRRLSEPAGRTRPLITEVGMARLLTFAIVLQLLNRRTDCVECNCPNLNVCRVDELFDAI